MHGVKEKKNSYAMLVPSMTWDEIIKEVTSDYIFVLKYMTAKIHGTSLRMKRMNEKCLVETYHIKTERMNEWSVVLNIRPGVCQSNIYLKSFDDSGIVAYKITADNDSFLLVKFSTHFFKRYKERMKLDIVKPEQVVKHFFKNNVDERRCTTNPDENDARVTFFSYPNGLGIGRFDQAKQIVHIKTFIAADTFTNQQKNLVDYMKDEERQTTENLSVCLSSEHYKNQF